MARMGMDVEKVHEAGRQLKAGATDIAKAITAIESSVSHLSSVWDGPDAKRFVHEWWPQHKKELLAAQQHIDGLGQAALNNESEQRHASAADAGGGPTGPLGFLSDLAKGAGGILSQAVESLAHVPGGLANMSEHDVLKFANDLLKGDYDKDDPRIALLKDAISHGLGEIPGVGGIKEAISQLEFLTDPNTQPINALLGGMGWGAGLAGSEAMSHAKNPEMFLVGMAASSVGMALDHAKDVDWSPETASSTFDYVKQHPEVVAQELGKAAVQVTAEYGQKVAEGAIGLLGGDNVKAVSKPLATVASGTVDVAGNAIRAALPGLFHL